MAQPQRIRLALSERAARYARRDAPVRARLLAAGGALPLPPPELAAVLFALAHDPEPEVKDRARRSLEELPEPVLLAVLEGATPAPVLSYLARLHRDDPGRLERIALNPAADDETLVFLAGLPHPRLVEILSQNQERMLRCDALVDALGANPLTGRAVIDRILGFLGRDPTPSGGDEPPREIGDEEAEAALRALLGEEVGELCAALAREGAAELDEEARRDLHRTLARLTVAQRARLARFGNREARTLLLRDANRIVATAAIRSPRIREDEVLAAARSRNVCDEVLRVIADSREWTRNYQVKLALCANPKTPLSSAMRFLPHLHDRDLRVLVRSREVPAAVSAQARRILSRKEGRR